MKYTQLLLALGLLVGVGELQAQAVTPAQDSLLQYLVKNQDDLKSALQGYQSVTFNWSQLITTLAGFIFLIGLTWKLWAEDWIKNHIKAKAQEAVESMANLKGAKILVLTSVQGNDDFLRSFFKAKKFPNVRFGRVGDDYRAISDFDYEVVFANNDDGQLNQETVRKHFQDDTVLFYFGKEHWDISKDSPVLSRSLNMANSRAQIYGNLMSSLEFLELVKPKIKNI